MFAAVGIFAAISVTGLAVASAITASFILNQSASKKPPQWCRSLLSSSFANCLCFCGKYAPKEREGRKHSSADALIMNGAKNSDTNDFPDALTNIAKVCLIKVLEKEQAREEEENNREDWNKLATLLDRCVFIICFVATAFLQTYG